jgi:phosphoribosylamine-glycine ligase
MNKKKIIILGAGYEQTPAIKLCKKLKIESIVFDKKKNAYGKKYADKFYNHNITNYKTIIKSAKKLNINGILTLCSEAAVPICSKISEKLNLQGISGLTAKLSTNKAEMKKIFQKENIATPNFAIINNYEDYLKFKINNKPPFVIKPTDSSGQKGIFLISTDKKIKEKIKLIKKISSDKKIIVEKYYDGYEINVVAIVENKNIKFLSISHRKTFPLKNFGIAINHIYPSKLRKEEINKIKKISKEAIKAIGITDGIAYPQILITKNKEPKIIEIASRIPGGFMREMALLVSGIDPVEFAIKQSIGQKNILKNMKILNKKKAVFIQFFTKKNFLDKKKILNIEGIEEAKHLKGIYDIFIKKISKIPNLNKSSDRIGSIIAYGDNLNDARKNFRRAINKIVFKTK